ncbi:hypothetical protein Tsubulata_041329 [Turnera subulata]|uniref:BHLH domain-containing protein n=1 Tax=Turnera subulata TaxID=218843 RepID=A0A9Q0J6P8_9ROSI|nr:hypothetical protein Tsubulata_041329 [Turnera subulata]
MLPDELLACGDHDGGLTLSSDSFINPFYELDGLFCYSDDPYSNLIPYFSSPPENQFSLTPEIFPLHQEFYSYPSPKRPKTTTSTSTTQGHYYNNNDNYHPNLAFDNVLEGGYVATANPVPELLSGIPDPPENNKFLQVQAAAPFATGRTEPVKKPGGVSLSAQSIAARERRRKITEKTQELGKLIPGGNKMNTAEMFQAASKYVKFLRAQIGILNLMHSTQETKENFVPSCELQTLLISPTIQEKLYSEEKCLVPRGFRETIAKDY